MFEQLLTDPERKKHFDTFGVAVEEGSQFRQKREYSQYRRFDPLDELFGNQAGGFKFRFQDRDITLFHKLSVTTRYTFLDLFNPLSGYFPYLLTLPQ